MMMKKVAIASVLVASTTTMALGQKGPPTIVGPPPGRAEFGILALDPINIGQVVLNAPYTAEAVTEVTQALADGNRIERRVSAAVARDSRGRTRREQQALAVGMFVAKNEQPIVTIIDPENDVHITLNYDLKIAFRATAFKLDAERVKATIGAKGQDLGAPRLEVHIEGPPGLEPPDQPGVLVMSAGMPFETGSSQTETLEPKTIEGVAVEGTRRTTTIAAGAMGNLQPIEIVSERWYSPELQVIVMTRRYDPRFGESTYRLTNIERVEPSPDLFKIPPDFKIEDMRPGKMRPVRPDGQ